MFICSLLLFLNLSHAETSKSDHFDGSHYFNPDLHEERGFWDLVKWKLGGTPKKWPDHVPNITYDRPVLKENEKALFTFINHASFLIQTEGFNVLTDPVFSERVGPFLWIGPKRVREPGLKLDELPPLDVVLVSHNHYDHMDRESLLALDGKFHPLFLVPLGEEKRLKEWGIQNVKELDWWQEVKIREATITLTRVQHWSNRSIGDKNKNLWGGYMVKTPRMKFYFAGDTGYGDHFTETFSRLGAPDVALLPMGAYEPRWFMKIHHMNPEEAIRAHQDLQARKSIGMHFGTFQLTDEGYDDPVIDLKAAREKLQIKEERFQTLDQGQSFSLL
jgi:L-ascorbate metabolism protein UlaG (beta-lactamase superfamily)